MPQASADRNKNAATMLLYQPHPPAERTKCSVSKAEHQEGPAYLGQGAFQRPCCSFLTRGLADIFLPTGSATAHAFWITELAAVAGAGGGRRLLSSQLKVGKAGRVEGVGVHLPAEQVPVDLLGGTS